MNKIRYVSFKFVDLIPDRLPDGVLYVSIPFSTAVHNCCCGCGNEVVTPLDPTDWRITFNGESVSLFPSIGNWSFDCESHYWICRNQVKWARLLTETEIAEGRERDHSEKTLKYSTISERKASDDFGIRQRSGYRSILPRISKWLKAISRC